MKLDACPHCGCLLRQPGKRSPAQNRLWWRYMTLLGAELGYTAEEMHEACKVKFLSRDDLSTGLTIVQSTAHLPVERFTLLINQVREWSHTSLGIYLPAPNEAEEAA